MRNRPKENDPDGSRPGGAGGAILSVLSGGLKDSLKVFGTILTLGIILLKCGLNRGNAGKAVQIPERGGGMLYGSDNSIEGFRNDRDVR